MSRRRVGILISGRGSNMQALVEAARDPSCLAEIVVVISNRPDAAGLDFARQNGIATEVVDHRGWESREAFERQIDARLAHHGVEIVCLAGFMRVLTPWLVGRWQGRMLNIHPSLLPDFKGLHTHRQALAAGVREHGATVHHVVAEMDAGPIIAQAKVAVLPDDTEDTLAARVLEQEHLLYPAALDAFLRSGGA